MRKTRYFVLAVTGGSTTAWRVGPALGTPGTGPPRPSTWLQTFPRTHQVIIYVGFKIIFLLGKDLKKKKRNKNFTKNILLLNNIFGPIGREKQNCTYFLLVVIQLFIKKTKIFLMKFVFLCF